MAPEDERRAFWRFPVWQRTIVLVAGSATHFVLALVIFFAMAVTTGLPNPALRDLRGREGAAGHRRASPCVVPGSGASTSRPATLRGVHRG